MKPFTSGAARLAALGLLSTLYACHASVFCLDCVPAPDSGSGANAGTSGGGQGGGADGGAADGGPFFGHDGGFDANGIGCTPSKLGERCNGLDDDCDGTIDEGFDLQTNPLHCGACNQACSAENADAVCSAGKCTITSCFDGFADLDGKPGCEYRCPVFPTKPEDCNGSDDDCDGKVDEQLIAPPTKLCRNTPGTPCAGVKAVCDTRVGTTTWYCAYGSKVEFDPVVPNGIVAEETRCDGFDGDCDGVPDDPWPELGTLCGLSGVGACQEGGQYACNPADRTQTLCDLSLPPDATPGAGASATELCNGIDDDCDGFVDDSKSEGTGNYVIDDMVHVVHAGLDFWIYRYEASRADATDKDSGLAAHRSCSKGAALPWTYVSYDGAAAACAAGGFRLCSAPEWLAACEAGTTGQAYPYGAGYAPLICNGADYDTMSGGAIDNAVLPTGSLAACVTADGVLDMSGNVKEWTNDLKSAPGAPVPNYAVRGGSYISPELGLTCQTDLSQQLASTVLPSLGFRCCSGGPP